MSRNLLIGAAVVAAAALVMVLRPSPAPGQSRPPSPPPPAPAVATTGRPRLVDLGAKSCIPCKAMVPVLDGLRTDFAGRLDVDFIDVRENGEAGEVWGVSIIPTQVFLAADGRELGRHEGFISREDILARWARLGVKL